jgi:hypothetical protein
VCYVESSIGNLINKSLDDGIEFTLTARMYRENEEVDDGSKFNYTWYKNGTKMENENSKDITVTVGESRNAEFYFEAERKQN